MPTQWVDWSKTTRSKDYRGSGSFATFLIIGPVCFFLGILFASFPYDFPLLWTSDPLTPSYLDHLETHLRFMHQSPPLIARMLHIIIFVGFLGFFTKLFRPSEANVLFDGGSLMLYVIAAGVYLSNIVKGMRAVSQPGGLAAAAAAAGAATTGNGEEGAGRSSSSSSGGLHHRGPLSGELVLGREDSLRVMSASRVILALVLVGVLVLQAGQWYAERKEADDYAKAEKEAAEKRAAAAAAGKKKL
ncbi:ff5258ae-4005-4aba-bb34-fa34a55784fd [Thermothielavioides terrestris]|uniref:Ff5258ae-4005-4aba-bb34-fa34a55784fd n=1 Tax=Thermothielavioides terrestris TaxID=2587410 RepID=A0A446B876_9PEZI|nr:ff5258ae-4005-4aba-bb34-fa34a55784fd [Thermothielavioides terrestris]